LEHGVEGTHRGVETSGGTADQEGDDEQPELLDGRPAGEQGQADAAGRVGRSAFGSSSRMSAGCQQYETSSDPRVVRELFRRGTGPATVAGPVVWMVTGRCDGRRRCRGRSRSTRRRTGSGGRMLQLPRDLDRPARPPGQPEPASWRWRRR
jgi:hypothetical protein